MQITNTVKYVGVNDRRGNLFEGQYNVPNGMCYNSYVIIDEKIAVMDSVDAGFTEEWLGKIEAALGGKAPDYLVVQHMEPDHSSSITHFMSRYPDSTVVSSQKAFAMMKAFYGEDYPDRRIIVREGDLLTLGQHKLSFIMAPMVHWPEVVMTYDSSDRILFSADGFGKFGAIDAEEEWADEAARYYFGIVGKYGAQVASVLKKAVGLDIAIICPLHGPVLKERIDYYLGLYSTWASYTPEKNALTLAYTSAYGNTARAAERLKELLTERGITVESFSLGEEDLHLAVASAFRTRSLVLAAPTYNMGVFPHMARYLHSLAERGFTGRKVGFIENGSWAPAAAKVMKGMLEGLKGLEFYLNTVTVVSALNADSEAALVALADEIAREWSSFEE